MNSSNLNMENKNNYEEEEKFEDPVESFEEKNQSKNENIDKDDKENLNLNDEEENKRELIKVKF